MLSHEQRNRLIVRFADSANWRKQENDWDHAGARFETQNGIDIHVNGTRTAVVLIDQKTRYFLRITKTGDRLIFEDEAGRNIRTHVTGKEHENTADSGIDISYFHLDSELESSMRKADIRLWNISIAFEDGGQKRIFFRDSSGLATFTKHNKDKGAVTPAPTFDKHLHTIEHEDPVLQIEEAKKVVAGDIGIDHSISATGTSRSFTIEKSREQIRLATSADGKSWLSNHGRVFFVLTRDPSLPEAELSAETFFFRNFCQVSQKKNVDQEPWQVMRLRSAFADSIADRFRHVLAERLYISPRHFLSVPFEERLSLAAIRTEYFEAARSAYFATKDILHAIMEGLPEGENTFEFLKDRLERGGDPRYIHPGLHTFADMMIKYNRPELLAALTELQGNHKIMEVVAANKPVM
ncbi:MAG: hypothetical protein IT558_06645 [Alphaproteobacteria bacterium]|nr:hypothetical protein [Alphaproteobacteria bacterium]